MTRAYWEQYHSYWSAKGADPTVPQADQFESAWSALRDITGVSGRTLEVGSGAGRFTALMGPDVVALDISHAALRQLALPVARVLASADCLPHPDQAFARVVCWATFDACDQTTALPELLRVTALGGAVLITGKARGYAPDDAEAIAAEVGARRKGHPNAFTDLPALVTYCEDVGFATRHLWRTPYRGDWARGRFQENADDPCYEYIGIWQRLTIQPLGRPPQIGYQESGVALD